MTMKLASADGTIGWRVHHGGASLLDDRGWSIVVGPDDNPVVTGIFSTLIDPARYHTMKLDAADGSLIWGTTIPGAINHIDREAGWLAVCDNGDIIMANRTWESSTSYDVVLHRYAAADGDTIWTARYNSSGTTPDDPLHMCRDTAGDLLVAGVRSGDFMILKFDDSDGGLIWSSGYDGPASGYDTASRIIEGPNGEVIATGFSDGPGTSWDVTTVAFDPSDGTEMWDMCYDPGDGRAEEGKAMAVSLQGDLYVAGFGAMLATGSDMLALRYSLVDVTGVATGPFVGVPVSPIRIAAYPNPFVGSLALSIELPTAGTARVAVYDVRGRLASVLHEGVLERGDNQILWNGRDGAGAPLATGVYFVRIESAGMNAVRKVVLSR